jgi:hypothetical protein
MPRPIAAMLVGFLMLAIGIRPAVSQAAKPHSCSLPELAPGAPLVLPDTALLAAYNGQAARIHSIVAAAAVRGWAGTEHANRPTPALIYFREPAWLRLTGEVPFSGRRSVDLFSDGRHFWLLVPDRKTVRLFEGPVDAPADDKDPRADLRPQPMVDALRWPRGTLSSVQTPSSDPATRIINLDLPAAAPFPARTAAAEFDLREGVVKGMKILDAAQHVVLELQYSDWQPAEQDVCFPRRIVMTQPLDKRELDIRIASLRLNERIPAPEFRMAAPIGVPVTHLPGAGTADEH